MRIAILCPNVSSNPLVRTYPIAKVLERRHELQVLGFEFGEGIFAPYRDEFTYDTVKARPMPDFWRQVRAMARKVKADAVYAFKPVAASLWVGLWAKKLHNIPLFVDVEDWEAGWFYDRPLEHRLRHLLHVERPNGFLWTWVSEKLAGQADETFVVSRFLQQQFGGTMLPHGPNPDIFDPEQWTTSQAREKIGLDKGRYIVFTGQPMPNKGLDDLCEALDLLGYPDVRVLVVGSFQHDPAYKERLVEKHGNRLVLIGPRPHAEMPMFLAAGDVVALPQQPCWETKAQVPGKVFEAMAMARPIVATAVSDLPEILDDGGIVVPPLSIEKLATALKQVLDDPEQARDLGLKARQRCIEHYSWDAMERILDEKLKKWE